MVERSNLLDMFSESLPDLELVYKEGESTQPQQGQPSSQQVRLERPPNILITQEIINYKLIVDEYLKDHAASLEAESATPPEPNRLVRNEADVVAHARTNLLNPIMRAVDVNVGLAGKISTSSELGIETLRVDVGIFYALKAGEGIVMMVEFKKANMIQPGLFESAMWSKDEVNHNMKPYKPNVKRRLQADTTEINLIKQAKAYARRAKCLYVALCDYQSLLLLKFSKDLQAVYITIVDPTDPEFTFRKALFGFLLTAVVHYNEVPAPGLT